ncbi:MAG: cation transporter [Oscillospiraceae bacterium]
MATGIIIALLIAICITAIKSYLKKLAHGCCGADGDDEKADKSKPDMSDCKYRYTVYIGGMTCKNCAARIENAFSRQGIYVQADFKNGTAEIYSKSPVSEFTVRQTVVGLGYSVGGIEKNEP